MTRDEFALILKRLRGMFPCSFPPAQPNDTNSLAAVNASALWGGVNAATAADVNAAVDQYVDRLVVDDEQSGPTFLDTARLIAIVKRVRGEREDRENAAMKAKAEQDARDARIQREADTRKSLVRDDNFKGVSDEDLDTLRAEIVACPPPIRCPGDSSRDILLNSGAFKYLAKVNMRRSPTWKALVDAHLKSKSGRTIMTIEAD